MNEGRIEQIGSPKELRMRLATPFVAQFLNAAESGPLPQDRRSANLSVVSSADFSSRVHCARVF
jgi:ABC-type Fe3+/spermidine/putrescine transport system ATPase subunit